MSVIIIFSQGRNSNSYKAMRVQNGIHLAASASPFNLHLQIHFSQSRFCSTRKYHFQHGVYASWKQADTFHFLLSLPFRQTVINGYFGKIKLEPIYSEAARRASKGLYDEPSPCLPNAIPVCLCTLTSHCILV